MKKMEIFKIGKRVIKELMIMNVKKDQDDGYDGYDDDDDDDDPTKNHDKKNKMKYFKLTIKLMGIIIPVRAKQT